jgi:hypothetical protein
MYIATLKCNNNNNNNNNNKARIANLKKIKVWRKIHHANIHQRNLEYIYKLQLKNFRRRKVIRDKEWPSMMIKGSIFQEDITIFNANVLTVKWQN